jgi:hypothetical protein
MRISKEAWRTRHARAMQVWEELLSGPHPTNSELAEAVEYHGTPTASARRFVAQRLRDDHPPRDSGRRHASIRDELRRMRRAGQLHDRFEVLAAAFDMQGIGAPRTKAMALQASKTRPAIQQRGKQRIGSNTLKRIISQYRKWAREAGIPLLTKDEAQAWLHERMDAGLIALDPKKGWTLTGAGKENQALMAAETKATAKGGKKSRIS